VAGGWSWSNVRGKNCSAGQGRSQLKSATVSYLLRTGVFIFGKQCKTVFLSCFAQIHRGPQTPMAKGSSATGAGGLETSRTQWTSHQLNSWVAGHEHQHHQLNKHAHVQKYSTPKYVLAAQSMFCQFDDSWET